MAVLEGFSFMNSTVFSGLSPGVRASLIVYDVIIRFLVQDLDSPMDELTAHIRIGDDFADNALPDEDGWVEADWRTPNTPGPVEVTASVTDSDGETEFDVGVFWVAEAAP